MLHIRVHVCTRVYTRALVLREGAGETLGTHPECVHALTRTCRPGSPAVGQGTPPRTAESALGKVGTRPGLGAEPPGDAPLL